MKYGCHGAARWRGTQPYFPDSAAIGAIDVGLFRRARGGLFPGPDWLISYTDLQWRGATSLQMNRSDHLPVIAPPRSSTRAATRGLGAVGCALAVLGAVGVHAHAQTASGVIYPPWQGGANNPALEKGLEFTVAEIDNLPDFHGNLNDPKLVMYYGGNSFFALAPLVTQFEASYPQYRGRIYFETLPPGLLVRQLRNGGTVTVGNMTWTIRPDVFFAGLGQVQELVDSGSLVGPPVAYVTNELAIMVAAGNPKGIHGLSDLARPDIRLAMPNPEFEDVAKQIKESLVKAGGASLMQTVYEEKIKHGTAVLTHIHHRQTPLFIMQGRADAGVVWKSEAIFQQQAGHPISTVTIPSEHNVTGVYAGAAVQGAAHATSAADWLTFIRSREALEIFKRYGFKGYEEGGN